MTSFASHVSHPLSQYFWGDVFARHLAEGNVIDGLLGVAPTPGSTLVLHRETGKLVNCTEELCPFGTYYEDIGIVNRAPYAAGGGWTVGVSASGNTQREEAMADFLGFVCGSEQSIIDVIPNATGTVFTGADPFRKTHYDIERWVEQGYPRETTTLYLNTVTESLDFPNTVLDVRFPEANTFITEMQVQAFQHLNESTSVNKTQEERMAVAASIEQAWRKEIAAHDSREDTTESLKTIYQRSLNVYSPETESQTLSAGSIAGIIGGCAAGIILVAGVVAWWCIRREKEKSKNNWLIKREDVRFTEEVIGEGDFGVVTKGYVHGTPVAIKASTRSTAFYRKDTSDVTSSVRSKGTALSSGASSEASLRLSFAQVQEDLAILVKVRNPNIVQTLGAVLDGKRIYVVFEHMSKGSLATALSDTKGFGGISDNIGLQWAMQIIKGLQGLHSLPQPNGPLLHEELKSSNVMIDASFNAKITNYAIEAEVIGAPHNQGSLLWKAPEVLNGARVSLCARCGGQY